MCSPTKAKAQEVAKKITDELGGYGIFGVELFIMDDEVIFSEVSPRPHDTGMVTMVTQKMSEFEIHVRSILGLPVNVDLSYPGASYVIKSEIYKWAPEYDIIEASKLKDTKIRLFGKPVAKIGRRMGVALSTAEDVSVARDTAKKAANIVKIK
jgi:phosphoribosylglycinamide formyltransferase 2